VIAPPALRTGSVVPLVAPAGPVTSDAIARAAEALPDRLRSALLDRPNRLPLRLQARIKTTAIGNAGQAVDGGERFQLRGTRKF